MQDILKEVIALSVTIIIIALIAHAVMRIMEHVRFVTFVVTETGPDDLAAYDMRQVMDEAREITRLAAEDDAE